MTFPCSLEGCASSCEALRRLVRACVLQLVTCVRPMASRASGGHSMLCFFNTVCHACRRGSRCRRHACNAASRIARFDDRPQPASFAIIDGTLRLHHFRHSLSSLAVAAGTAGDSHHSSVSCCMTHPCSRPPVGEYYYNDYVANFQHFTIVCISLARTG